MGISDLIAGFIQEALDETDGVLELQRSDLAQRFGCVPSQINYVMSTRFSPEHGYIVESRRGGGGYIRITRVQMDRQTLLMHVINSIGDKLDGPSARAIVANLRDSQAIAPQAAQAALCAPGDDLIEKLYPPGTVLRGKSVLSFTPALCAAMQVSLCVQFLTGRSVKSGTVYYFDLSNQEFESIPMI